MIMNYLLMAQSIMESLYVFDARYKILINIRHLLIKIIATKLTSNVEDANFESIKKIYCSGCYVNWDTKKLISFHNTLNNYFKDLIND